MIDPNQSMLLSRASLIQNSSQDPLDDSSPDLAAGPLSHAYADFYRRKNGSMTSQRSMGGGSSGSPMAQHLAEQVAQPPQQVAQPANVQITPQMQQNANALAIEKAKAGAAGKAAVAPNYAGYALGQPQAAPAPAPAGADAFTAARQASGGNLVQVMRGDQTVYHDFRTGGESATFNPDGSSGGGGQTNLQPIRDSFANSPAAQSRYNGMIAAGAKPEQAFVEASRVADEEGREGFKSKHEADAAAAKAKQQESVDARTKLRENMQDTQRSLDFLTKQRQSVTTGAKGAGEAFVPGSSDESEYLKQHPELLDRAKNLDEQLERYQNGHLDIVDQLAGHTPGPRTWTYGKDPNAQATAPKPTTQPTTQAAAGPIDFSQIPPDVIKGIQGKARTKQEAYQMAQTYLAVNQKKE